MQMRIIRSAPFLLILLSLFFTEAISPARTIQAQSPCGVVDSISYPLDTSVFSVVYPYGRASNRFDGRLHAGEDWVGPRSATYGTPVRAIARGRVTYSAPLGWGLDKGVVIVEHLLPDGTWWYSLYGHMEEVNGHTFPAVYTCVNEGDILGAIGRPRPAPHLHLEIRNFGSDAPGPGYWGTNPTYSGWQQPSRFITNWQGWMHPAYVWHTALTDQAGSQAPAIIRTDGVTVVYDDARLKAINPNGQILWRYILPENLTIIGVLPYQNAVLVADATGIMQLWSLEGGFVESWHLPEATYTSVTTWGDLLLVHTTDRQLIAYGPDRAERWRVADIYRPLTTSTTDRMMAVISTRGGLTFLGPDGRIYGRATVRGTASATPAPDGGFYVRTQTALWHVDAAGKWNRLNDMPAIFYHPIQMASRRDGRFFLYAGSNNRMLYAYGPDGAQLWAVPLESLTGTPAFFIDRAGSPLVLADSSGQIVLVDPDSGAICDQLGIWGTPRSSVWVGLGQDGILRLHIADQMLGLNWATLTASCS